MRTSRHFSRVRLTLAVTNVLSEANRRILEREDRPTDVVPLLTELDMPCFTHFMANLSDTTRISSSSTSRLI